MFYYVNFPLSLGDIDQDIVLMVQWVRLLSQSVTLKRLRSLCWILIPRSTNRAYEIFVNAGAKRKHKGHEEETGAHILAALAALNSCFHSQTLACGKAGLIEVFDGH